jgi:hypothetical protein
MKHYAPPSLRLLIATAVTALVASVSIALSTPATLSVDGQRVVADVAPVTSGDQAYVPIRALTSASGGDTAFDAATGTITIRHGSDTLEMKLGQRTATLNGAPITLAHAPFVVRGRTMVGSTVVADAFGSKVRYDVKRARVEVRNPGVVVAGAPDDDSDSP